MPPGAIHLFLLGLAAGVALLTVTSYRRVSPAWLRWLLTLSGLFVASRYLAMALFAATDSPQRVWGFRHCWFATSLGFPLAGAFAVDQLIRHPAMTPAKLLRWLAPFLAIYAAVILVAPMTASPDRIAGWTLHLTTGWQRLLGATHLVFTTLFLAIALMLMRKIPSKPIRIALAGLSVGFVLLALDGVLSALHVWYFRPYLFSELFMLLALWHAFETASSLQNT